MPYKNKKNTGKLSKAQSTAVKQIVKKQITKVSEVKSYIGTATVSHLDDLPKATNLIYPMLNGVTSTDVIGEKISIKNIHVKAMLYNTTNSGNIGLARFALIRTEKALTSSTSLISVLDVFNSSSYPTFTSTYDYHKINVLASKQVKLVRSGIAASDAIQIPVELKVNLKGKSHLFTADGSGYLKHGNYYLVCITYDGQGATTGWTSKVQWSVNFMDD